MGLFNIFKKKSVEEATSIINLRKETVSKICLEKKMSTQKSRVALVLDYSGSMSDRYESGAVQELVERIIPVALQFDDDGELDMWFFSNSFKRFEPVTIKNFDGYIDKAMKKLYYGGTNYAPVLEDIKKKYVDEKPSKIPTYVIFVTDGDCFDHEYTRDIIKELSNYNIFIQFIGIDSGSSFLRELDNMSGRFIDNANYIDIPKVSELTDEQLYNKLLNEYPKYLQEAKNKGLI